MFDGNIYANVNTVFGLLKEHNDKEVNMVGHKQMWIPERFVYHESFYTCVPGWDNCINVLKYYADKQKTLHWNKWAMFNVLMHSYLNFIIQGTSLTKHFPCNAKLLQNKWKSINSSKDITLRARSKCDKSCIKIVAEYGGPTKKNYDIKMAANG